VHVESKKGGKSNQCAPTAVRKRPMKKQHPKLENTTKKKKKEQGHTSKKTE
jgi:hypothetical protein